MNHMREKEVAKIKTEFREICQTFLDLYHFAADSDAAWGTRENPTDAWLWNRIGMLERQLELIAPGTGPRYTREADEEQSIHAIALWCGLEMPAPEEALDSARP